MRKAISLLLALCMMFALCGCGSSKSAQLYSVANNGIGFSADKIESISENMDDMLDIEAVKVTHDSIYYARIKNNYTVKEGDEPNRIMLQFNLIDKQGSVVETNYMIFDGVEPNQSCWGYIRCQTKYTDISAIKFIGYMFQFDTHNINDPSAIYGLKMMGGGNFTEPIVYAVDDIEIEGVTPNATVDSIDLTTEVGNIKYVGAEVANEGLVSGSGKAVLILFDFTNLQSAPTNALNKFTIKFFQNNVEIDSANSYSSKGGDRQYDLACNISADALNGGTVTFAEIAEVKDDSPITVMVYPWNDRDNYQMMVVDFASAEEANAEEAEEIAALLEGKWHAEGDTGEGDFAFDNGSLVVVTSDGSMLSGTYTVNIVDSTIDFILNTTDGSVKGHLPYTYDGSELTLYNNRNTPFVKQ